MESIGWLVVGHLSATHDAWESGRTLVACDQCGSLVSTGGGQLLHERWHERDE